MSSPGLSLGLHFKSLTGSPLWWKVEKCQICHLYHFPCRHIKLILIGPINGPFTPRVSCSNWIHMFRWHQMTSSKKQEILSNKFIMEYKWVLCKMTCTWFECMRDDGWIYGMTFVFCGLSQIWDCDMCTGYLVVICRTVLLLHLHNVHPRATLSLKTYQKITN